MNRRAFLAAGSALTALANAPRVLAQWQPSQRYPDPLVRIIDPSFAKYRLSIAKVEKIASGMRWSEGPVWFGDGRYLLWSDIPNNCILGYYEGQAAAAELPTNVYRWDPQSKKLEVVAGDINRPNGLAFSPDESKLYIVEAGVSPRVIRSYEVVRGGTQLANGSTLITAEPNGTPDGLRVDVDGNLWVGWGMGEEGLDGVSVFNPQGTLIGRIDLPERCANLCFGGRHRNRLFMCGSTSMFSLFVNTQGATGG
jgi:sugar lactone lactonase YvrE